ncbi:glycosyltransferase family 2 protein, partial [Caldisericum sp.]
KQKNKNIKPQEIYAPFGACIIFHRNYFEAGGTLNTECFLFGEEIFVAETARKLNLRILYDPELKVIHHEHSSISILKSKQKAFYAYQSIKYYIDKFFKG